MVIREYSLKGYTPANHLASLCRLFMQLGFFDLDHRCVIPPAVTINTK